MPDMNEIIATSQQATTPIMPYDASAIASSGNIWVIAIPIIAGIIILAIFAYKFFKRKEPNFIEPPTLKNKGENRTFIEYDGDGGLSFFAQVINEPKQNGEYLTNVVLKTTDGDIITWSSVKNHGFYPELRCPPESEGVDGNAVIGKIVRIYSRKDATGQSYPWKHKTINDSFYEEELERKKHRNEIIEEEMRKKTIQEVAKSSGQIQTKPGSESA